MNAGFYGKICAMPAPHSAPFRPLPTPPSGRLSRSSDWRRRTSPCSATWMRCGSSLRHSSISSSGSAASSSARRARSAWFTRHHADASGRVADPRHAARCPRQDRGGTHPSCVAHRLRQSKDDSALFFDETRVPVETITLANPEIEGLTADQFEVIGEKVSHRLAQRPGSYVILKYVRPVIKRRDTQTIHCPAAPPVIDGSRADVSFIAGLITDKFCYHQPLYRQHQRLGD